MIKSFNVLDDDYVLHKYKGAKNNRLETIEMDLKNDVEDQEFKDVNEKEEGIKEEEIIPIIQKEL